MIFYYIVLTILFFLWLLFAFNFHLHIKITHKSLILRSYFVPLLILRGKSFYRFIGQVIPKDTNGIKKDIDYSRLVKFIHIDKLYLKISLADFFKANYLVSVFTIIQGGVINILENYVKEYNIYVSVDNNNELIFISDVNFNIGIILLNVIMIKFRYRHGKIDKQNA